MKTGYNYFPIFPLTNGELREVGLDKNNNIVILVEMLQPRIELQICMLY